MVLDELGPLLLDGDRTGPEGGVLVGGPFLDDLVAGLGLDPCLLGVIDAAREVAMGSGDRGRRGNDLSDVGGAVSRLKSRSPGVPAVRR